jgi:hypothetical protein
MFKRFAAAVSLLLLLSFVAGCGGGGGGGGDDVVRISSNVNSLQFSGIIGETITPKNIEVTLTNAPGNVYVALEVANINVTSAWLTINSGTTATITVAPSFSLAAGTHQTTVSLRVYRNSNGTDQLASFSFPVTVALQAALSVNPTSLAMGAVEGGLARDALAVTLAPGITGTVSAVLAPGQTLAPWLTLTVLNNNTVEVDASAVGLAPGVYQREIQVGVQRPGGVLSVRVPLTFTVGVGLIAPADQTLTLNRSTELASLAGSVNVVRADGSATGWGATSSEPWLTLTSSSGTTPGTLAFAVEPLAAGVPPPFSDSTATVTITAAGITPVTFKVTLQKRLTYVVSAAPYGMPADAPARIIVGGAGFNQLVGDPQAALDLHGLNVSSIEVLSDTQLALTTAPQAANSYSISVNNASGIYAPNTSVTLAAQTSYPPGVVPHGGAKNIYVHDPVRRAVYALSRSGNALVRYRFDVNSNSWAVTSMPHGNPLNMALSPDGNRIWITDTNNNVVEVLPDTMSVFRTYTAPFGISQNLGGALPMSSDGRLWLPGSAHYFDTLTRTFGTFSTNQTQIEFGTYHGTLDGSMVMISPSFLFSPRAPYWIYEPVSGNLGNPMGTTELGYEPRFNLDGSRTLDEFTGQLYNRAFALLGQIPAPAAVDSHVLMTLTPDGNKILVLRKTYTDANKNTLASQAIDIYTTGGFSAGTTNFLKLFSLPITTDASICDLNANPCFYGNQYLLPTQDSKTLFWIGNQNMQVFSIP